MGESSACRICGLSREMLWDYPELQRRFVWIRFGDAPGPPGTEVSGEGLDTWFCHSHAGLGLKYAGMPAWLAWQAILTTTGILRKHWPRERGLGAVEARARGGGR